MNILVELKAGRELDALVAEKVMGDLPPRGYSIPDYSTSISAAWEVVEKLIADSHIVALGVSWDAAKDHWKFLMRDFGEIVNTEYWPSAPTAPLAICRAALKAVDSL